MNGNNEFIKKIEETLPNTVRTVDLIKAGIYTNPASASYHRRTHGGPDYFRNGKKIFYSKESIIQWLKACSNQNDEVAKNP